MPASRSARDVVVARTQAAAAAAVGKQDNAQRSVRQFQHAFHVRRTAADTYQGFREHAHVVTVILAVRPVHLQKIHTLHPAFVIADAARKA